VDSGLSTTNTVSGLVGGVTYLFDVTAYNSEGAESLPSNQVSFTPGTPNLLPAAAPAGQFGLTISGTIGHIYEVEATQDFKTWTPIGTVSVGSSGSSTFTDSAAANFPYRFYRIRDISP
jgi:phospholipase C